MIRRTILIITAVMLMLFPSCSDETGGKIEPPDWMYSESVESAEELSDVIKNAADKTETLITVPAGKTIGITETIEIPANKNIRLTLEKGSSITEASEDTKKAVSGGLISVASGAALTVDGTGILDGADGTAITTGGTLVMDGASVEGEGTVIAVTGGTVTINGGTFSNNSAAALISVSSGTLSVPEASDAQFIAGTEKAAGTVFSGTGITLKGGTYHGLADDAVLNGFCGTGFVQLKETAATADKTVYKVAWSNEKAVADIINGLSQDAVKKDLASAIDNIIKELTSSAGGSGEGTDAPSPAASTSIPVTGSGLGPYTITFDEYTGCFKSGFSASVRSGKMTLEVKQETEGDVKYTITSAEDIVIDIDGQTEGTTTTYGDTVTIKFDPSTGNVHVSGSSDIDIFLEYPEFVGLKVARAGYTAADVKWADVEGYLDEQGNPGSGSSAGNPDTGSGSTAQ